MSETDRLIKKYPNRRLYDTRTSTYITLSDVKGFVLSGERFKVVDARSRVDLTRSILLQIIVEEEDARIPLFTEKLLGQMLCFYGHSMQATLGRYLEVSMESFSDFQNRLQEQSHLIYGDEGARMQGEMWAQFLGFLVPAMRTMMDTYMEQSKRMADQMQNQLRNQTQNMFSGIRAVNETPDSSD